jgi:purine-cytosine permease-like protein
MSSFALYLIGYVLLAAGLLVGADLLGLADRWLWVMGLVLLGFGVITAVTKTRRPDAPASSVPDTDHT